MRVFVNETPTEVADGGHVLTAVRSFDVSLAEAVQEGRAYVTDGVGRELEPSSSVKTGDILRVVVSARRGAIDQSP